MILAARLFAILYRELSVRPMLAFTIASLTASFITAYAEERKRIDRLVRDTIADMESRSDEIEARIARARTEEYFAPSDGIPDTIAELVR